MHHIHVTFNLNARCIAGLLCILSMLTACQQRPSETALNINVPIVRQQGNTDCGLACLRMLYQFYGRSISAATENNLNAALTAHTGLKGSDLQQALKQDGFNAFLFSGNFAGKGPDNIRQHLQKGRPLLLLLANPQNLYHYVILTGMERDQSVYFIADPASGKRSLSHDQLSALWQDTKHFCLLAMPK